MSARMHLPDGLVTFLFTDIEGSTRLAQMLGATYRSVLTEHRRVLRRALSTGDGVELFTEGDSLFVAFADASAALAACADAQRALADHVWPAPQARPLVRMGLHTGRAQPIGGEYASAEVHRAARVAAAAHGGQVLCSAATAAAADRMPDGALLTDLGLHRLRGFDGRERLFQLVAPGLEREFPRPRTLDRSPHNLPTPVTSFVGRVAERRAVPDLIRDHRLVTLVGPGGVGKTRLAIEAARELVGEYPDGVWFVDLAGVEAATDGPVACVAAALGLRPEPGRPVAHTLADHVAGRQMLLLLDTCDARLPAAAALVGRLLDGGRGVWVLATSREPLGLPGELVRPVAPLPVHAVSAATRSDAATLLLDRGAAARGGRPLTGDEAAHLDRVAKALAGLPLALELAAARLRVLSARQLADRLDDVLGTLDAGRDAQPAGGPTHRHRTMRSALDWSYRTLDAPAARLLRWLSVFAGPVELPAIEWLGGCDPLGPLATLVDKSLIQAEPRADGATYRLLDPIRSYAARALGEAGEDAAARDRHAEWCLRQLGAAQVDAQGRPVTLSLNAIDPIADEVRAALRWTTRGGSARQGLAVTTGVGQWWSERGLAREGRQWLSRLHDRIAVSGEYVPDAEMAAGYHAASLQAAADGDYAAGLRLADRAGAVARRAGDDGLLARVRAGRGALLLGMGRLDEAELTCRAVAGWARGAGVAADALPAVYTLAQVLWRRGDLDEAADLLAGARPLEASRPAERGSRTVDLLLGLVALSRRDVVAAHDHLAVALRSRMACGYHARACGALNAMAVRCLAAGDALTAVRLFGAAQAARARLRPAAGAFGPYWQEQQAVARSGLGDAVFDATYAEGARLTLDDAVAVALTVEHPDLAVGSDRFSHSS